MLDELGLVHMNGRIYDPLIGRFLSADKIVDGPFNLQGYNRYSYVSNNPLSYHDPDGYQKARKYSAIQKKLHNPMIPRVAGALKAGGGALEFGGGVALLATPEPTMLTKAGVVVMAGHGADTFQAGVRQMISGENTETFTHDGIKATAQMAGASEETAQTIATVGDTAIGMVDMAAAVPAIARLTGSAIKTGLLDGISSVKPRSLNKVDPIESQSLTSKGFGEVQTDTTYIYVVDDAGEMKIAVMGDPKSGAKHTELTEGGAAKAAGELRFNTDGTVDINSNSGRFSRQSEDALDRVAEELRKHYENVNTTTDQL